MLFDLLVYNIGQLILPSFKDGPLKGKEMAELPVMDNAAFGVKDGKFAWIGTNGDAGRHKAIETLDIQSKVVSPGLVDPHTHLVFGGSRENELVLKQEGASYLEILESGGGIHATVDATRKATEEELFIKASFHLKRMLSYGVTTIEAKSGYGLDCTTELKQLRVMKQLQERHPVSITPTFLGPHAIPLAYKGREDEFLQSMIEMLERIKQEKLADFADIFCESGVFTVEQSRLFLQAAKDHGMGLKIHADEINSLGGAELAVELQAVSADHLVATSEAGIQCLGTSDTVAVLLPGTTFYLGKEEYAKARDMIEQGAAIALATDFNPGSCVTENLQMIMSLAALKMKMKTEEIWNAVTVNASYAIGKQAEAGRIKEGKQADFVIWNIPNYHYLPYHFGVNHASSVFCKGKKVWEC